MHIYTYIYIWGYIYDYVSSNIYTHIYIYIWAEQAAVLQARPPKPGLLSGCRRLLKPYDRSGLGCRGSARTVFTPRKDPQQLSPFLAAFAKRLLARAFLDHFAGFAERAFGAANNLLSVRCTRPRI